MYPLGNLPMNEFQQQHEKRIREFAGELIAMQARMENNHQVSNRSGILRWLGKELTSIGITLEGRYRETQDKN